MDTEVDPRVADNSFEAKKRSSGAWGEKANHDLKFTKGLPIVETRPLFRGQRDRNNLSTMDTVSNTHAWC